MFMHKYFRSKRSKYMLFLFLSLLLVSIIFFYNYSFVESFATKPKPTPKPKLKSTSTPTEITSNHGSGLVTGKVLYYNDEKRYGIIKASKGEKVYVNLQALQASNLKTLTPGQKVTFNIKANETKEGKLAATDVELTD